MQRLRRDHPLVRRATLPDRLAILLIVAVALVESSAPTAELVAAQPPTSSPPAPVPVAPIGQLGGATRAIAPSADGRTLWIGYGPRLARVDVSDRAAPRLVAVSALLPAVVNAIALDVGDGNAINDRIVVAAGETLYVFDAGDVVEGVEAAPTARIAVADGAAGEEVRELAVARGVAYARTDDGFGRRGYARRNTPRVWAVPLDGAATPGATQRPVLTEGWYATDVLAAGGRLYVASTDRPLDGRMDAARPGRLWVYDLAHPDAPRLLGVLDGAAWAARLASPAAAGGAAHVFGSGDGVVGVDLTDIEHPREILRWALNEEWSRRRLRSAEARLAATRSGGVVSGYTYGIGGEGAIGDAGSGISMSSSALFKTSVAGGFAAMSEMIFASETAGRITIAERTAAGAIETRGQLDLLGSAAGVSADPSRPGLLFAAVSPGGLAIVDATDARSLALGAYDLDGSRREDVDADGGVIVATYGGESDIAEDRPDVYVVGRDGRLARTARLSRFGFLGGRARLGRALYVAGTAGEGFQDRGVTVIDLTEPSVPATRAVLGTTADVRGIAAADGLLVVPTILGLDVQGSAARTAIEVYDAANALQPRLLRSIDASLPTTDSYRAPQIALAGRWALLYTASPPPAPEEMYRITALDLDAPSPVPHLWPPDLASPVFRVRAGFALAHGGCDAVVTACRINVIDVTTPATPTLAAALTVPASTYSDRTALADAQAGTVYVAAGAAGLYAFRPPVAWSPAAVPPTSTADPALSPTPAPTATPTPARLATSGVAPTAGATVRVLPTPAGEGAVYLPVAWGRVVGLWDAGWEGRAEPQSLGGGGGAPEFVR